MQLPPRNINQCRRNNVLAKPLLSEFCMNLKRKRMVGARHSVDTLVWPGVCACTFEADTRCEEYGSMQYMLLPYRNGISGNFIIDSCKRFFVCLSTETTEQVDITFPK